MSAPRVVGTTSRTVKTYWLVIEDGEIRDMPYSRVGGRYVVTGAKVEKRDGNVAGVELSGPVLKKDGMPGLNRASERFWTRTDWPEWLRSIVGGLA